MIAHLQRAREGARAVRLEGTPRPSGSRSSACTAACSPARSATRFAGHAPRTGARRLVLALIARGLAAEETVPGIRGIGRVCRIYARRPVPRARRGAHPPPPHRVLDRGAPAAPALARLRDRASPTCRGCRPNRIRSARSRPSGSERDVLPVKALPGSRRRRPGATFRSSCPSRSTRAPRPVRLRRARPRHRDRAPFLGQGAHRADSGARSGDQRPVRPRSWPSPAHRGSSERARRVTRGWAEPTGHGEARCRRSGRNSPGSSGPSCKGAVHILEEFGGLQAAHETQHRAYESQARRQARRASDRPRPHRLADGAARRGRATDDRPATYGRT